MGLMVAVGLAEAISIVTVFQSIAAVGAVLSVVGKVTGDKTLTMVGLGLGAVGGIGALAGGAIAGLASGAAEGATVGAEAATGAAEGAAAGANAAVGTDIASLSVGGEGAVVGDAAQFAPMAPGQEASLFAADVSPAADSAATAAPSAMDVNGPVGDAAWDAAKASLEATPPPVGNGMSGMIGDLVSYAGKNPVVAFGALQAGGSLLSGMTSTLTPAQVALANSQAAQAKSGAGLVSQQTANMAEAKAVAAPVAVTGTPAPILTGQPPGLINSITGRPA